MKKLMAVIAVAGIAVASVAMAMSSNQQIDEARVQAQIDGRLHQVLVKMRMHRRY